MTSAIAQDFAALTAAGGRLVGSRSEARAAALLRERLRAINGARLGEHHFAYSSWADRESRLSIDGEPHPCHALIWSAQTPAAGLEAEVADLGRGTEQDFGRVDLAGKIALVRHEYPFASDTIHRRVKYNRARERGAVAFLIANNLPGGLLVGGSCGQDEPANIPGLGIGRESAERVRPGSRAQLRHVGERAAAAGANLIAEIPGSGDEWIVVCAHYDGHDLAQSALDNATGVVAALAVLRELAAAGRRRRGVRVIFFTAEESGLLGSRRYVESLGEAERRQIHMVINLDTLAGSPDLAALTSGFAQLDEFVARFGLRRVGGLLRNSDHFNFAQAGIPALRLVAGFDQPESDVRYLLTQGDTAERVSPQALERGAAAALALAEAALT